MRVQAERTRMRNGENESTEVEIHTAGCFFCRVSDTLRSAMGTGAHLATVNAQLNVETDIWSFCKRHLYELHLAAGLPRHKWKGAIPRARSRRR